MALTSLTLLCCYNNHTCHSTSTIDRCSRTVLQNLETFNVISIQSCNSRRNQSLCITWWQRTCINIGNVFHDDTINNPQRFWWTEDWRVTTNTNLRSSTERTRHILNAHTGSTTFERTAHVRHTIDLSLWSINLGSSTREEAFVLLGHTRYDDLSKLMIVIREDNLHAIFCCYGLSDHTNVTDYEFLSCRNVDSEVTINIGNCTRRSTLYHDRCSDNGFSIVLRNYGSVNLCLTKRCS